MKRFGHARKLIILGSIFWLLVLGCRTSDFIARANSPVARTATRTVRPTFTPVPPTPRPTNTVPPPPTSAPVVLPTRPPTARPAPTRVPTTPLPPTPAPTPDPYAGFYFKPRNITCVTAPNTRIQGTVYLNGTPSNGVRVRVASSEYGPPAIDDFITGNDPADLKHVDPALQGKYQLGLYEGQQKGGTWFVFILGPNDELGSPMVRVPTTEGPGCNTATVDFYH